MDDVRRELESMQLQLEARNCELNDFAHMVSHDLKAPLRQIKGMSQLVVAKCGESIGEEGQEFITLMQQGVTRMEKLIDKLLEYATVNTKSHSLSTINMKEVVEAVLKDLDWLIQEKHAKVTVGELPALEADAILMRQVIQNLISNALKYTREGVDSEILVSSQISEGNENYEITLEDNGTGFDQEQAEAIFKPFRRLVTAEQVEGCGIGLAIVKKAIDYHGGTITATGTPGEGATFTITVPIQRVIAASTAA